MLNGLEINIKNLKEIQNIDENIFRIDSEHYQKKYQKALAQIKCLNFKLLKDLIKQPVSTGHTPSMKVDRFYNGSIKFIKTDNLRTNNIIDNFTDYLTEEGNRELLKTSLKVDDVITTIIGATYDIVGRTAILREENLPANINQNIALIRVNNKLILPKFLNIYLNTDFGRVMLHYHSRQTEQVNLNCREVERIIVPMFSMDFQKEISDLVTQAYECQNKAKQKYAQAEILLLETLGLQNFQPANNPVSIKTLSGSLKTSGRLDAEFYQEKYDDLLAYLQKSEYKYLGQLVWIAKSIEPGSDAYDEEYGLPFIRVSDYDKFQISTPAKNISVEFYAEHEALLDNLKPKKDTILFSKDGTVGIAYLLTEDLNGITSSAILHLNLKGKSVLPEYLTLVLNSMVVQMQAERDVGGSIIQHWRMEEIEKVVIPIISMEIQTQIADLIIQSNELRVQAQNLLAQAKQMVETEIETRQS